ncbi:MAG: sugar phosphate isomerase/epimerase [Clostridia bacterium]|nr:sugar phosphate isomerase/epimerase [Clostridia bacterium]
MRIFAFADEANNMIDGQIAAMRRNSLAGLEIRNVDGVNISDITADKAKEVRKKLDDAGFITWSVGSPIGKIDIEKDDFAAHTEKFKKTLELGNILGAGNIRLFSFYIPQDKNAADYKNEVIDRLGLFCDIAKGSGIELCHENEKGIYGDIAARCLDIHKALPQLRGIFDPANFVQCGQNTLEAWEMLGSYIKYMHIKDSLLDGTVVPAGEGEGNLPFILGEFMRRGGDAVTLEPHLRVFSGLAELEREGEESNVGKYNYPDNDTAFDAASDALKKIIFK